MSNEQISADGQAVNGHSQQQQQEEEKQAAVDTSLEKEMQQAALEQNGLSNGADSVNGDGDGDVHVKDAEQEQAAGLADIPTEPGPSEDPVLKALHRRQ